MRSVNKVTLLGHVGQDPKIISTSTGNLIANLSIATSYRTAPSEGKEGVEVTEWHRLVAFKRTAEIIRDYVKKGAALYVEGQLQTRSWEKDGEKRYSTEIVIREMSMLGSKPGDAAPLQSAGSGPAAGADPEISDDDIPF
jgi:single-strand DNA-binding protein